MQTLNFLGRRIGNNFPAYIISEIGVNFKTFNEGKKLIDASISAGVDCVKIQTFKAENLTTKNAMFDLPKIGKIPQFNVFKKYELSAELQKKLFQYAKKKKIVLFSTPSDKHDINFLEELEMPIYKIGSDDATNIPLLEYIANLKKPTIVSTGMCTMREVLEIKDVFTSCNNNQLAILHCVTKYPTDPKYANLTVIGSMKKKLKIPIGYSDHCKGIEVCKAAIALGANIIEKHVTLDKRQKGPDHILSATPHELKKLVEFSHIVFSSLGTGKKEPALCEENARKESRKSIIAIKNIPQGSKIKESMIKIMRPGYGIKPKYLRKVVGKKVRSDIKKDQVIEWSDIYQ